MIKNRIIQKSNKTILNIFLLPSFWVFLVIITSILLLNIVKITHITIIIIYIAILITFVITIIFRKNLNISIIFGLIFLFLSITALFVPIQSKYDIHIRNYLAFENKIEKVEYLITSYPNIKKSYINYYSFEANVIKIYTLSGEYKVYGKINIIFEGYQNPFSYGDSIITRKLPDYNSHFFDKGYIHTLDVPITLNLTEKDIIKTTKNANLIYKTIGNIRDYINDFFDKYLSPEIAGLSKSILLGDRAEVGYWVKELFLTTNTSHLLAISGLHLGILIAGVLFIFKLIGCSRKLQAILLIPFVLFFALLVGNKVGVIRASIMVLIGIIAYTFLERKRNYFNILFLTGIVVLVFDPVSLFNVGYQLSFLSIFAIFYFFIPVKTLFERKINLYRRPQIVKTLINILLYPSIITFSVQLLTFPIMVYNFGKINIFGIFANMPLIPTFTFFLYLCFLILPLSFLPHKVISEISTIPEFVGRLFIHLLDNLGKVVWNIEFTESSKPFGILIWILFFVGVSILIILFTGKQEESIPV